MWRGREGERGKIRDVVSTTRLRDASARGSIYHRWIKFRSTSITVNLRIAYRDVPFNLNSRSVEFFSPLLCKRRSCSTLRIHGLPLPPRVPRYDSSYVWVKVIKIITEGSRRINRNENYKYETHSVIRKNNIETRHSMQNANWKDTSCSLFFFFFFWDFRDFHRNGSLNDSFLKY